MAMTDVRYDDTPVPLWVERDKTVATNKYGSEFSEGRYKTRGAGS